MIGYITFGTNNLPAAAEFYDDLLAGLGGTRMMEDDRFIAWSGPDNSTGIGLSKPFDGQPATVGNGVMAALSCKDRAQVDTIYNKAIALGGSCEGPPGERMPGFYAGYFRDIDGNKLNAFVMEIA